MNIRKLRLAQWVVGLLGIVLAALCVWTLLLPSASDLPHKRLSRGLDAAWLGVEWTNEPQSIQDIVALGQELTQRQIKYVFVFTSYLKPSGEFSATYAHADEFVTVLKGAYPDLIIQAWIGLPLKSSWGSGYLDLGDAAVRERISSFCANMIQDSRFDGVHLDPEPVVNGDPSVLMLLDEVRHAIGPGASLSIASRRIMPVDLGVSVPVIKQFAWQADYYGQVARRVNQLAVMTYDSGLPLVSLYRRWVGIQVVQVSQAVQDTQVELLIGIPCSEERTLTHWPHAENVKSSLEGMMDVLSDSRVPPTATIGVAIYPYWEMNADRWIVYESLWLGR